MPHKSLLRAKILNLRRNNTHNRPIVNRQIFSSLLQYLSTQDLYHLGTYIPFKYEVNPFIGQFFRYSATPVITNKFKHTMIFGSLTRTHTSSAFLVRIPKVAIIPLVAFDCRLTRLGYGGGYYDRYFSKILKLGVKCKKIGVAFDSQYSKIPIKRHLHDVSLDIVITPSKIYKNSY